MAYPNYDEKTAEFLNYYANLLIIQYRGSEKNRDFIKVLLNTLYMDGILDIFKNFFDIEKASGAHLEILGKYVGAYRTYGNYVLSDTELRLLIKLLSAKNGMSATFADISSLLYNVFGYDVMLFNNYDMSITYFVSSEFIDFFNKVLIPSGFLPIPQGIKIDKITEIPTTNKLFGYADAYNNLDTSVIVGYSDIYDKYHTDWTWLELI